jgi:membrane protease YdiL (CAAX protease family)
METTFDRIGLTAVHRQPDNPALRPIVIFAAVALPSGWILLGTPVAFGLSVAPFVLATLAIGLVLPAVLLTLRDPNASMRALLLDCVRVSRRSAVLLVPALLVIPGLTWAAAVTTGNAPSVDGTTLVDALVNVVSSVLIVNLWEEMAWQGFFQRRAEARWGFVTGALVTAAMFVGVHLALGFADADDAGGVGRGMLALVVSGIGLRLLLGAVDFWSGRSILVVAVMHASFNVASEFVVADADWIRYAVTLILGVGVVGAWRARSRGGAR